MYKVLLVMLMCFPAGLLGQGVDSIAMKMVDSLLDVSQKLTGKRDFENAFKMVASAEAIALEKYGQSSALYATVCYQYGQVASAKDDYQEAEKWYIQSKVIQEKVLGKEHLDYAWSLSSLANLYWKMGFFDKAETLNLEALNIREKTGGKNHPDYVKSLNNLAVLYRDMGNYEKSEELNLEANAIREKTQGKEHPDYASSLNALAMLYKTIGDYEKAEPLYIEAKNIREKTLGNMDPAFAASLNNLANLYQEMGNYEKAEPLYLRAKNIREKVLGKEHRSYAASLNNLANLYHAVKNYDMAEPLHLEALDIRGKVLGKEHPEYAVSLNNLALLYADIGKYEKAELLYLDLVRIREKVLGKEHPDYAWALIGMASVYRNMGLFDKAEPLYMEAKNILENTMSKDCAEYVQCLDIITQNYWSAQKFDMAESYILEAGEARVNLLKMASKYLSERELWLYGNKFEEGLSRDYAFAQIRKGVSPVSYDNTLFYKGFLLNAVSQINKLALSDPATTDKYNQLKSYNRRLAAEYAKPIAERKNTADLEEKANATEKELARSVAGFGEALRQVTWQEVQQNLRPGEAAIEFVHYKYINPKPTDSTMYAALVLLPGTAQPAFIPLFEERQLDALLQTNSKPKPYFVNGLYASENAKNSLYSLLWQPLERELAEVQTVYFSPSGLLHRLNLGAIAMPPLLRGEEVNMTLADRYRLVELGSTRQLVVPHPAFIPEGTALLYGGLEYEMDTTATPSAISTLGENPLATRRGLDFANADSTLRGGKWGYLRWTDVEVDATEAILADAGLRTTLRKGYAGTEESFKAIGTNGPSPRVLHLATHGFFFPDPAPQLKSGDGDEPVFKVSDHPMIRSGLVLTGGNYAWKNGKTYRPDREDGILTAYEISQMNLSNTDLVVLSACETGLGDIQGNEGVYGLQRAFKIAGAKYLIMSLWQVPDFQTQELMTSFYSLWLEDKMPLPDAFRAAQKAMREKYKSPFLWAGFVLVE